MNRQIPKPFYSGRKNDRKNDKKKKKDNKVILPDVNLFQINVNGGLKDEYVEILTEGTDETWFIYIIIWLWVN